MASAFPMHSRQPVMPDFCRAIVDGSPMGMVFASGLDHTIVYANDPFCRLVGKALAVLRGESFAAAAPAGEECLALLERVYHTGLAEIHLGQEGEASAIGAPLYWSYVMWPVLAPDGSKTGIMIQVTETTPFHTRAMEMNQALMIASVHQHELREASDNLNAQLEEEIVQRKRVESELQEQQRELSASEDRYRGLIAAIPQIVWTATPAGQLDFGNAKCFEYFGNDLTAFNSEGWHGVAHPDDRRHSDELWRNGLQSGAPFEIEHRLKHLLSGDFRWHFSRAAPIFSESGAVVRWFGTSTDVEDQKHAQLASFNQQKLESLGLLAGGVAHDFNNLLCSILGNSSLAAGSLPKTDPVQESLANIVTASERAAHLTRQMLAYAGKGRYLIEQVNIPDIVTSTCALIKASIPKSVELILETSAGIPPVAADSGQMQQVIMNLVLNAAEAIDDASTGVVVVKTEMREMSVDSLERQGLATLKLRPGSYVVVQVRDNGRGMDAATKAKVFDPFFTTKFTGRGLGLAAVAGIARSQGGAVAVDSVLGEGTTFAVYLPVSPRVLGPVRAHQAALEKTGTATVLVVDDDTMVRRVTQLSLEDAGFHVILASGGEEALQTLLSDDEAQISLVVLDLRMPGMSGKQVMEQMKVLGINIPVLLSSGYNEREVRDEFLGIDFAGFIQKPFTPRQLGNCVIKLLYPQQQ